MGSFSQGNWCWGIKWRRNLFDYEQHIVVAFMEAITDIQIQLHMQDIIKYILRSFELASGLKINFAKSSFGAIGKSDQWWKEAAEYLNCRILSLPFMYLGIPIGDNPRRNEFWDPILQKCERKLSTWKHRHISFGGRVTLINSILTTIPIYFFSFFRVQSINNSFSSNWVQGIIHSSTW